MAILSVVELNEESGERAEGTVREYVRTFLVRSNRLDESSKTVRLTGGVPRLGQPYVKGDAFDLQSLVRSVSAEISDTPYHWRVTCNYSTKASKSTESDRGESEEQEEQDDIFPRPQFTFGQIAYSRALEADLDGKPMLSGSNDPLDPPVEVPFYHFTIAVSIVVEDADPEFLRGFVGTTNSSTFLGMPRDTVRCNAITGGLEPQEIPATDNTPSRTIDAYRLNFEFEYNPSLHPNTGRPCGWLVLILNQSRRTLELSEGDPQEYVYAPILDANGVEIVDPVPIHSTFDDAGKPTSSRPLRPGEDVQYLERRVFERKDFGDLNLF